MSATALQSAVLKRKKRAYYKNETTQTTVTNTWRCYKCLVSVMGVAVTVYYYVQPNAAVGSYLYGGSLVEPATSVTELNPLTLTVVTLTDETLTFNGTDVATRYRSGDIVETSTQTLTHKIPATAQEYDFFEDTVTSYLPKVVQWGDVQSTVLFEKAVPGTYELTLKQGAYDVIVVGAGGGASSATKHSTGASGGSGSAFKGRVFLNAGTYTVQVGAGGPNNVDNDGTNGGAGGASFINDLIIAGAGGGGLRDNAGGTAGVLTLTITPLISELATNGQAGVGYYGGGSLDRTPSVYNGFGYGGAGGRVDWGNGEAGGAGYVKIVCSPHKGWVQHTFYVRRKT